MGLSYAQVEQLWTQNGGPAGWAPLMAAIAMAESGGNTQALNNTPATGDYSVGLWQINYYNGMLAGRTASYGSPQALLADPNKQAKAAISLFGQNGSGLGNWQGDAAWKAWRAAGAPQQPSAATVESWGVSLGGASTEGLPAGSATTDSTTTSSTSGTGGDPRTCGAKGGGVDILFGHIGTACQLKALTAGLLIGLGGAVMMIGVVVLVGRTKSVREAVGAVAGGVAGGPAGVAKGASLGAATAPVKAPKVPAPAPVAPAVAPAAPAPVAGPSEDYGQGWLDGVESMLGGGKPQPRNKRQATRQAESLFDQLGISSPGPSARQTNSLGADLPF
jgi:hypothetical protein